MNRLALLANSAMRHLDWMFPGFFAQAKHNHYADFGYPEHVTFRLAFDMYERNGIARAAVAKTIGKTWRDFPFLQEKERVKGSQQEETVLEAEIRKRFDRLRLWQHLAECDRRGMVGAYSGLILRIADGKPFSAPIEGVRGGLEALVEVIPAWEGQLTVSEWDTAEASETYGQPKLFQFNEAAIGQQTQPRSFQVHPDRVLIWSKDGTVNGSSDLKPGYNSLLDIEKIVGAGGEGFWKNAKSAPYLEIDKDAKLSDMAKAMGVPLDEIADKMDEQVDAFNRGFDKSLMLQGIVAKPMSVNLPSPEHFFLTALQCFAASVSMPLKILVGSQTGERASTEDSQEWAQTNMSRRTGHVIPNILMLARKLEAIGILPAKRDWFVFWTDLTESSPAEKIDRANKMADTNQKMKDTGEYVFTPEEIRAAVDLEPLSEADKYREDTGAEDDIEVPAGQADA